MEQLPVVPRHDRPETNYSRAHVPGGKCRNGMMKKKKGPEAEFTVLAFRAASHNMGARRARRACTPPVWPRR